METFKKFAACKTNKIGDTALLLKGDAFYCELLQVKTRQILEGLEDDIKPWRDHLKFLQTEKEERLRKI